MGDGTTTDRADPIQVAGVDDAIAVAAGGLHSLAVKRDGTVWAWGNNGHGQLGDGTTTERTGPVQVADLTDVVAVAGGLYHSLALRSDGTVWGWGDNSLGQVTDASEYRYLTPVRVATWQDVTAIDAGEYLSTVLRSQGALWTWGTFDAGLAPHGPEPVLELSGTVVHATGPDDVLAVLSDSTVWELRGYSDGSPTVEQIPGLTATALAAGGQHALALTSDGVLVAWGHNKYGQLGDGNATFTPEDVEFQ